MFKTVHPDKQMSRTASHNLRPQNILTYKNQQKNVCTCIYGENIKFKFVPIKPRLNRLFSNYTNFICASNACANCKEFKANFTKQNSAHAVFHQFINQFLSDLYEHRIHCHTITVQQIYVKYVKINLSAYVALGISDYSEHFICLSQDEVQTAGYGRDK